MNDISLDIQISGDFSKRTITITIAEKYMTSVGAGKLRKISILLLQNVLPNTGSI